MPFLHDNGRLDRIIVLITLDYTLLLGQPDSNKRHEGWVTFATTHDAGKRGGGAILGNGATYK